MTKTIDLARQKIWRIATLALVSVALLLPAPVSYAADAAGAITTDSIMGAAKKAKEEKTSGISILQFIFGPIVQDPLSAKIAQGTSGGDNPITPGVDDTSPLLGGIFGVINLSLLALGTIYLSYSMMAGVAQTAQDGEFLGKRFSTLWIPARLVTGIVGLVPAFGGWSLAQLVIIWASVMGVGIGNLATTQVVKNMNLGGTVSVQSQPQAGRELAFEVFKMNVCVDATNKVSEPPIVPRSVIDEVLGDDGASLSNDHYYDYGACGRIHIPQLSVVDSGRSNASAQVGGGVTSAGGTARQNYINGLSGLFERMQNQLSALSKRLVDELGNDADNYTYNPSSVMGEGNSFSRGLRRASRSLSVERSQDGAAEHLEKQGFAGLGVYFTALSSTGMNAGAIGKTMPSVVNPAPKAESLPEGIRDLYARALTLINARDTSDKNTAATNSKDGNWIIRKLASMGDECGIFSNGLGNLMTNDSCFGSTSNILLKSAKIGESITIASLIAVPAVAAMSGSIKGSIDGAVDSLFGKVFKNPVSGAVSGAAKEVTSVMGDLIMDLLKILAFFGGMLAYYLPLLPYIAWLGAMISWVSVVLEGVIAAPLWAFAHMDTDGEGMGQKAQYGYLFLLQVLLRPVLMVVGFIAAILVMEVMGSFFFATFPLALGDAGTIGGFYDLIGVVIAVGVFFTTSVMIVNLSTNLIHFIPNVALQWMGTHTTASGTAGEKANGEFAGASAGGIAYGKQLAGQAASNSKERKKARDEAGKEAKGENGAAAAKARDEGKV